MTRLKGAGRPVVPAPERAETLLRAGGGGRAWSSTTRTRRCEIDRGAASRRPREGSGLGARRDRRPGRSRGGGRARRARRARSRPVHHRARGADPRADERHPDPRRHLARGPRRRSAGADVARGPRRGARRPRSPGSPARRGLLVPLLDHRPSPAGRGAARRARSSRRPTTCGPSPRRSASRAAVLPFPAPGPAPFRGPARGTRMPRCDARRRCTRPATAALRAWVASPAGLLRPVLHAEAVRDRASSPLRRRRDDAGDPARSARRRRAIAARIR